MAVVYTIERNFGPYESVPNRRIEIMFNPCTPKVMTKDEPPENYNDKCLVRNATKAAYDEKLQEIKDWIGKPNLIFVYNKESLDLRKFNDASIHHSTSILNY